MVLDVARENAAAAGLRDRYTLLPGDAFEVDYGGPYDVVLVTESLLHHFDPATCEKANAEGRRGLSRWAASS